MICWEEVWSNPDHPIPATPSFRHEVHGRRWTTPTRTDVQLHYVINSPEVHRIVLKHVMTNNTSITRNQLKWLRSFSGKVPKAPSLTWLRHGVMSNWCYKIAPLNTAVEGPGDSASPNLGPGEAVCLCIPKSLFEATGVRLWPRRTAMKYITDSWTPTRTQVRGYLNT